MHLFGKKKFPLISKLAMFSLFLYASGKLYACPTAMGNYNKRAKHVLSCETDIR